MDSEIKKAIEVAFLVMCMRKDYRMYSNFIVKITHEDMCYIACMALQRDKEQHKDWNEQAKNKAAYNCYWDTFYTTTVLYYG